MSKYKKHLAIFSKIGAEAILSGKKTVETRFSQFKIAPFGQISIGDIVFIKISGGEIVGQFKVKQVHSFEGLEAKDLEKIFQEYGEKISLSGKLEDQKYQQTKVSSRYGTLIFITQAERLITSPIKFKKKDLRGWVVLDKLLPEGN